MSKVADCTATSMLHSSQVVLFNRALTTEQSNADKSRLDRAVPLCKNRVSPAKLGCVGVVYLSVARSANLNASHSSSIIIILATGWPRATR